MKYFSLKNKVLFFVCLFTMFNSLSIAKAAEESFTLLGSATIQPVTNSNPDIYVVVNSDNGEGATLYSDSKNSSREIRTYPEGYAFTVLGSEYGWIYVEDDHGNRGYINGNYLAFRNGEKPENKSVASSTALQIVEYSKNFLGTPYVWGGTDLKHGVDCSGLIYKVYGEFGISLQRVSRDMYSSNGEYVSKDDLVPGDLLFFNTMGSGVSHVGMYIGDDQYIHAGDNGVAIADLYSNYSVRTYVGAKRILF